MAKLSTTSALLEPTQVLVGPQPGPQTQFLSTRADIAIYGGEAGGGKTIGLILNPLRHIGTKDYNAVIFRRTTPQIINPGGLWDQSKRFYPLTGGVPHANWPPYWSWPETNAVVRMSHLQHDSNAIDWQGSALVAILFDELTHFSSYQFWYMLSRNRNPGGVPVRPYMRATCNPDPDSFVAGLIGWYINNDGFAIPERSGVLRYFLRYQDDILWGESPNDLTRKYGRLIGSAHVARRARSFTFIHARLADNRILETEDPEYRGKLEALGLVERSRLLDGNWHVRAGGGMVIRSEWFKQRELPPQDRIIAYRSVRSWDKAATEGGGDWTVGVLMAELRLREQPDTKWWWVLDVIREQLGTGARETLIQRTAVLDGYDVEVTLEQEPGSSGVDSLNMSVNSLAGFDVSGQRSSGNKLFRIQPFAAQCEHGFVSVLPNRPWVEGYLKRMHLFPTKGVPDDEADATSGAFKVLDAPREWVQTHQPI